METEPTQIYQPQLEELKAKGILWIWEQMKLHPWISFAVTVVILVCLFVWGIPAFVRYCRKQGLTKASEIRESEHLNDDIRKSDVKKKRITILPAPAVDPKYCDMPLPSELEELVCSIEQAESSHRTRRCVVCRDKKLTENYARMFYHRIVNAPVLDKYGWVYYKKPSDDTLELCIEHCFFASLRIFNEIPMPEKRFIRQVDFFDQPNVHTLLVISKVQNTTKQDDALLQIASLEGLSVVIFADKPVPGYHIVEIP